MTPAMTTIVRLLDQLTTMEIHELQTVHLPRARQEALASMERTTPVRPRESAKTIAVEPAAIQRSFEKAFVETHGEGELD